MLNRNQFHFDRREQVPSVAENRQQGQNIVTFVPRQTKGNVHSANSPHPDIYRQALRIISVTPEIEGRSNYIAAGMIVTVLGSWLGSAVLKSRAFTVLTFILLFFFGAALAGLFLGAVLGKGFIPVEPLQVVLFAIAGISVFVLGVGLTLLLLSTREDAEEPLNQTQLQPILIPVKELNPHAGRRKTD